MAPALADFSFFSQPSILPAYKKKSAKEDLSVDIEQLEIEALRSENLKLQRIVEESQRYKAELMADLEKVRMRLLMTEEAEEHLCSQLGELEAESVLQARDYNHQINSLKQQLAQMQDLLARFQRNC
ncbi:hypothetical protein SUGI_0059660 [Cryptomeria japonica]|uniref:protein RESPONSE TO LOW SULFUR 4-like n=1 Tax=Cryptomeria japonica TaxID=3369 RepID=UPI002408BC4B|nr:protein RESPONSE TO LOW SULFUR 4-like [Cryptomeria japonica]GLJ07147.1 hypothetical protein SUGI_0059660 [Cryptomeria japonica]